MPRFITILSSRIVFIVLTICLLLLFVIIGRPELRDQVRYWFRGSDRKILATLRENLQGTEAPILALKVKEKGALFMEFYVQKVQEGAEGRRQMPELFQKLELPNPIDAYFTFMGQATNLAVANLDGDDSLELIVPSYNLEFAASLDVIKFNTATNQFQLMSTFDLPKELLDGVEKAQ